MKRVTPLTEEQLIKRRESRRKQIVDAAFKVFALRGLNGAKMSMIAEEAGLSAGQLYRFFESKEELFTTLIQQAVLESTQGIEMIYQLPGSPFEKVHHFISYVMENKDAQYPFMLIHHAHTADDVPKEVNQLLQQFSVKRHIDLLLPLFEEGQQAGEFAQGDIRQLISALLTMLSAIMTFNMPIDNDHQMPDADMLMRIVAGSRK
ncbi:TetR/AcrR family transcriptional regulator [Bacillus horti]|uniref:AcrR family transcriptional regulator n=1 Tax=Caldalkalibacillus horti TaxID=77523 RepID=A0ABT9VWG8_9BACI|nr:AcrR family transcriptional regulator [Bacillus horti]